MNPQIHLNKGQTPFKPQLGTDPDLQARQNNRGSVLILALLTVSVAITLLAALAIWINAQQRQLRQIQRRYLARQLIENSITLRLSNLNPTGTDPGYAQLGAQLGTDPDFTTLENLAAQLKQGSGPLSLAPWGVKEDDWWVIVSGDHGDKSGSVPNLQGSVPITDEAGKINAAGKCTWGSALEC